MNKNICMGCAALAVVWAAGCATTRIAEEWRAPETVEAPYRKVFVAAVTTQESVRRSMEDAFASTLAQWNVSAVPSYEVLEPVGEANHEELTAALKAAGADAALVVRFVAREQRVDVSPAVYGPPGLHGGYRFAWAGYYEPPTVYPYEVVLMEVRLYDVAGERLVWAGSTESRDPARSKEAYAEYAELISARLGKIGLLPEPTP